MNTQVIYYSKYGSTKEIVQNIGKKLGTDNITDVRELKDVTGDLVIVGSPIYAEKPHKEILRLLKDEEGKLKDRRVALFVVCLSKERVKAANREVGGPVYLNQLEETLGRSPVAGKIFGGRMIIAEMEEEERKTTEAFYKKLGMPFVDVNLMSEDDVDEFVQDIKTNTDL